jgi:hypothetical protein
VREACGLLAGMGLKIQKDSAQGRIWINLNKSETIRKRYMYSKGNAYYKRDLFYLHCYETDILRLKVMWHRSGEPPFSNWLKQLISREAGPGAMTFFVTS